MKRQIKALALTIALLTTTACGAKAEVKEDIKVTASEAVATKEAAVANTEAPRAQEAEKTEEKENQALLIPQTVELADKANEELAEEVTEIAANTEKYAANELAVEAEEAVAEIVEETVVVNEAPLAEVEEVVANEIVEVKEEAEVASEKVVVEEVKKEEAPVVEEVATRAQIDSVTRTSESTSLPNTVEANVASATAVEPTLVEEIEIQAPLAVEETPAIVEEVVEGGLTKKAPSAEAVKAYWTNYQSKAANTADFFGINLVNQEDIFAANPNTDLNALELGALSQAASEDALHIANTVRFATGLNEMTLGADQAALAQAATMVNRLNLAVSHNPVQPAGLDAQTYLQGANGAINSNLAASFGLLDSVVEYVKDDLGENNQLEVGHRRWILNPAATAVGFGQTDEFNAMFVNNNNYSGQNANEVVAYPSTTAISEFHSADSSLSLMFGENFDITNAAVEVIDLATGEVRTDAHIDQAFTGYGRAITFGKGMNYAAGTKLQVKVTGVTKNGVAYPIEYTINYMSIR